jgi:4-hydroxy-tetrahydrodipicolinate reductase
MTRHDETAGGNNHVVRVVVAGATGWAGQAIARAVRQAEDLQLVGAVARRAAGADLGQVLGDAPWGVGVVGTVDEALAPGTVDVLVDYTHPRAVSRHVEVALAARVRVVVGTSGLSGEELRKLGDLAAERHLGIVAAGNFSLTAALAKHFTLLAARHLPSWELIDYAGESKVDAPSGTVRELAEDLAAVAKPAPPPVRVEDTIGLPATRGGDVGGTRVHAVRLPGVVLGFDSVFGAPGEQLHIHYQAGPSAEPYVAGTLLAVRRVMTITGLVRGLDRLLFETPPTA